MKLRRAWLPLVVLELGAGTALGQATAVQLPTYSFFSTATTVSVPDRGSVYLGGVKRAATGRNEFGSPLLPFKNRGIGTERSASNMHVSVYIHDFDAMDEYLLSQPTRSNPYGLQPRRESLAGPAPRGWQPRADVPPVPAGGPAAMSVAELRAKHLRQQQTQHEEALSFFERGQNAEAAGKANVARIYYQMAARRAGGELKDRIAARLEAVGGSTTPTRLAQGRP